MAVIASIAILLGGLLYARIVDGTFCNDGFLSPNTGYCYYVYATKENQMEIARSICRDAYGGDIPSIYSNDENAFIHDLLSSEGSHTYYWIGVNDLAGEDTFRDVMQNEIVTYTNWASGEPDDDYNFGDCAVMKRSDGQWKDLLCYAGLSQPGVVCQQPPPLNPYTLCPANMLPYMTPLVSECYLFSLDKKTALEASEECALTGSKLAFIEDQELNDFFLSYIPTVGATRMWIGTQQVLDYSGQMYHTVEFGTTNRANYEYFVSTYSGTESPVCVAMNKGESGQWNQLPCNDTSLHFVCQFNPAAYNINETTTLLATTNESTTTLSTTTQTTTTTEATTTLFITTPITTTSPTTTEATTTMFITTPTTTSSPTTTESTTVPSTMPTTTSSLTTPESTTTLPTTMPTTTTSPNTTESTTTLPTTTPSTTTSPTTTEYTTTLPITPTSTNSTTTTTESTTTLPTTRPTTTSTTTTTESTTVPTTTPSTTNPITVHVTTTIEPTTVSAATTSHTTPVDTTNIQTTASGNIDTTTDSATSSAATPFVSTVGMTTEKIGS